jgi:hypothetical protein
MFGAVPARRCQDARERQWTSARGTAWPRKGMRTRPSADGNASGCSTTGDVSIAHYGTALFRCLEQVVPIEENGLLSRSPRLGFLELMVNLSQGDQPVPHLQSKIRIDSKNPPRHVNLLVSR